MSRIHTAAVPVSEGIAPPRDTRLLRFLYNTLPGRLLLRLLSARWISRLVGAFMESRLSMPLIGRFVKKNNIDLSEFESDGFTCFNDCFSRRIKNGLRPIDGDPDALISPCDGLLSAYRLEADTVLPVKQSAFTLGSLLRDEALAEHFSGGVCLVFRLCVTHYHRYCYPADAEKGENVFLKGRLHTVRPVALAARPVFTENCREYTLLSTDRFGTLLQMEVGALLVGKIANLHGAATVERGEEKGMFLYGGSTVILLLERDRVALPEEIFVHTAQGLETPVRMGEALGYSTAE